MADDIDIDKAMAEFPWDEADIKIEPNVQCECQCSRHMDPHGLLLRCPRKAEVFVDVHHVGNCKGPEADPDLDTDGNMILRLCLPCLAKTDGVANTLITQIQARIPAGARMSCPTCGIPVAAVEDLNQNRRPI